MEFSEDKEYNNIESFCKSYYQAIGVTNLKYNIFKKNVKTFFCFINEEGISLCCSGHFNKKFREFNYNIIKLDCCEKNEYVCEKKDSLNNSELVRIYEAHTLTLSLLNNIDYYACIKKALESGKDLPYSEIFHPNPLFLNDSELEKIAELSKEYGINIL